MDCAEADLSVQPLDAVLDSKDCWEKDTDSVLSRLDLQGQLPSQLVEVHKITYVTVLDPTECELCWRMHDRAALQEVQFRCGYMLQDTLLAPCGCVLNYTEPADFVMNWWDDDVSTMPTRTETKLVITFGPSCKECSGFEKGRQQPREKPLHELFEGVSLNSQRNGAQERSLENCMEGLSMTGKNEGKGGGWRSNRDAQTRSEEVDAALTALNELTLKPSPQ